MVRLTLLLASLFISFTFAAPLSTSSVTISTLPPITTAPEIDFIKREAEFDNTGVAGSFNLKGGHKREALPAFDNTGVAGSFNLKGGHKREASPAFDNTGVAGSFTLKGGHKREAMPIPEPEALPEPSPEASPDVQSTPETISV